MFLTNMAAPMFTLHLVLMSSFTLKSPCSFQTRDDVLRWYFGKRVRFLCAGTHVRGDVGSDLPQDVLAVHQLDSDGHHQRL